VAEVSPGSKKGGEMKKTLPLPKALTKGVGGGVTQEGGERCGCGGGLGRKNSGRVVGGGVGGRGGGEERWCAGVGGGGARKARNLDLEKKGAALSQ